MTRSAIAAGINLYAYAGNNPVTGSDPRGLQAAGGGAEDAEGIPPDPAETDPAEFNPRNLYEVWPWEHAKIDPARHLNYQFVQFQP